MKNRTLLIIFGALLGIYLLSKALGGDKQRTFDPEIVALDTAVITEIMLNPKAEQGQTITLTRSGERWSATMDGRSVAVPSNKISGLLGQLQIINAKRVVSNSPDNWAQYEVGEQGSRVQVKSNGKSLADFVVGTFKFDQAQRSASSYVRRTDEDEVFIVDGFLSMQFNQGFDAFRDNAFVKIAPENLRGIEYSGAETAVLQKQEDGIWYYAGMEALDSTTMAQYVNGLSNSFGADFTDDQVSGSPLMEIQLNGNNMLAPVTLRCYASSDTTRPFILHSSQNPETRFLSDSSGVYQRVFGALQEILAER